MKIEGNTMVKRIVFKPIFFLSVLLLAKQGMINGMQTRSRQNNSPIKKVYNTRKTTRNNNTQSHQLVTKKKFEKEIDILTIKEIDVLTVKEKKQAKSANNHLHDRLKQRLSTDIPAEILAQQPTFVFDDIILFNNDYYPVTEFHTQQSALLSNDSYAIDDSCFLQWIEKQII